MKKEEKKKELARILPIAWNSYQHMYDVREKNVQNEINFLLVVISFMSIISISLLNYSKDTLFFLPFLFQMASFLILIKSSFIKKHSLLWLELSSTLEKVEKGEFDQNLFAILKALENDTWIYLKEMQKIIRIALSILLSSVFLIILILFDISFGYTLTSFLITVFLFILYGMYIGKQLKYKNKESFKNSLKEIEDWLNKK